MLGNKIGLGIVGSGRIGTLRARLAAGHSAVATIAVSDLDAANATKLAALVDTRLLSLVYLELQGGKERALEFAPVHATQDAVAARATYGARPRPLAPRSTPEERARHADWVAATLKDKALWLTTAGFAA